MRRFNQQTWFCIAAVWLAGSLSMYWAEEIRIPAQELTTKESSRLPHVIRRQQALIENVRTVPIRADVKVEQTAQPAVIHTTPSLNHAPQTVIAPLLKTHPKQLLVPENDTPSPVTVESQFSGSVKANGVLRIPDTFDDQQLKPTIEPIRFENQTKMPEQPALWLEGRIELSE
ncbi:hypothetical protein [Planctomicrobium sp. SH527]|uniref:hypothetical protein n=1 Tax=Planctomicrobium sp. SH527 TaxID=3448123 RepID=UPI003F5C45F2